MALIIPGALASAASGKQGGTVFARNKGGQYVRNWAKPTNPNSQRQVDQRGVFVASSVAWQTLTDPQRANWDAYAASTPWINRLGVSTHLSGFNMFQRLNTLRLQAGLTVDTTSPASPGLGVDPIPGVVVLTDQGSGDPSAATIPLTQFYNTVNDRIFGYIGLPVSAGVVYYKGPWLWAGALAGNDVSSPNFLFTQLEANTSTQLTLGEIRYVAIRQFNSNGRVSNLIISGPHTVVNIP